VPAENRAQPPGLMQISTSFPCSPCILAGRGSGKTGLNVQPHRLANLEIPLPNHRVMVLCLCASSGLLPGTLAVSHCHARPPVLSVLHLHLTNKEKNMRYLIRCTRVNLLKSLALPRALFHHMRYQGVWKKGKVGSC
jgi:hypothetical protein